MSGSSLLIGLLMLAIAIVVLTAPFRGKRRRSAPDAVDPRPSSTEYEDALVALRDLDFDHELGVVAEDDYERLREQLVAQAARCLQRPKQHRPTRAPGVSPSSRRGECPECGQSFQPSHRYCGTCGTRLPDPRRRGPRHAA